MGSSTPWGTRKLLSSKAKRGGSPKAPVKLANVRAENPPFFKLPLPAPWVATPHYKAQAPKL